MKESKKALLELLKKTSKKESKFDTLVVNLALQKVDGDSFDFDGELVLTADKARLVYCLSDAEHVTIPEGVTVIGEMAFRQKKHLKSVSIPSSVKEIEKDAFYDCDELDNVCVPASVSAVRAYAFAECDQLKTITFEGVPKHLSRNVFSDCDRLHNIIVPAGSAKAFMKALHFINEDTDFLIVEEGGEGETSVKVVDVKEKNEKKAGKKDKKEKKDDAKNHIEKDL